MGIEGRGVLSAVFERLPHRAEVGVDGSRCDATRGYFVVDPAVDLSLQVVCCYGGDRGSRAWIELRFVTGARRSAAGFRHRARLGHSMPTMGIWEKGDGSRRIWGCAWSRRLFRSALLPAASRCCLREL